MTIHHLRRPTGARIDATNTDFIVRLDSYRKEGVPSNDDDRYPSRSRSTTIAREDRPAADDPSSSSSSSPRRRGPAAPTARPIETAAPAFPATIVSGRASNLRNHRPRRHSPPPPETKKTPPDDETALAASKSLRTRVGGVPRRSCEVESGGGMRREKSRGCAAVSASGGGSGSRSRRALHRGYSDFTRLDLELREELEGRRCCARELPVLPDAPPPPLPQLPAHAHVAATGASAKADRRDDDDSEESKGTAASSRSHAADLTRYLSDLIRMQGAVHSAALERFLTVGEEEEKKEKENEIEDRRRVAIGSKDDGGSPRRRRSCVDYLLPREDDDGPPTVADTAADPCGWGTVPSRGTYTRSIPVPPGWWLVWRFRLVRGPETVGGAGLTPRPVLLRRDGNRGPKIPVDSVQFKVSMEKGAAAPSSAVRPSSALPHPENLAGSSGSLSGIENYVGAVTCFVNDHMSGASVLTAPSVRKIRKDPPPLTKKTSDVQTVHTQVIHLLSASSESVGGSYRNHRRSGNESSGLGASSRPLAEPPSNTDDAAENNAPSSPPDDTARLQFSPLGHYLHRISHRIRLDVIAVPDDAFRAACVAARDQSIEDERMRRSPLLRAVLESDATRPARLVVEPVEDEGRGSKDVPRGIGGIGGNNGDNGKEEDGTVTTGKLDGRDRIVVDDSHFGRFSDNFIGMKCEERREGEIRSLRATIAQLRDELRIVRSERDGALRDLRKKSTDVDRLHSERRLWVEGERDMNEEIVSLHAALEAHRTRGREAEEENGAAAQCPREARAPKEEEIAVKKRQSKAQDELSEDTAMSSCTLELNATSIDDEMNIREVVPECHPEQCEEAPCAEPEDILFLDVEHPDDRLNAQLTRLRERRRQLLMEEEARRPEEGGRVAGNWTNDELRNRIERAIRDVVRNALALSSAERKRGV